jgi:hypothetical protein
MNRPYSAFNLGASQSNEKISIARPSTSKNWHPNSKQEFIANVMKTMSKREKNEIKPIRKLETMFFHNILYKVKQQKEDLDEKIRQAIFFYPYLIFFFFIRNLDRIKMDLKESDICLLGNSRAIDYILKLYANTNPNSLSNTLLSFLKQKICFFCFS